MSNLLVANGEPGHGSAWVRKNITAVDEVYVTLEASFDATKNLRDIVQLLGSPVFALSWDGSEWVDQYESGNTSATPTPQPLGAFQTLELHYDKLVVTEPWVDGVLLWTFGEFDGSQISAIRVGNVGSFGSEGIVYIDNVKIGTTRGGSDIFFDDFASGDLSAWDSQSGDVSVDSSIGGTFSGEVEISVAFEAATLDPLPGWTSLSSGVHRLATGFRIDRGRNSEFDKTVTGTASVDLIDKQGKLDPTNDSSPFAGNLDPMKNFRIRIRNPVTGVLSYLFRAYTSDWDYEVDESGVFTKTTLECADAFDLLSTLEMTPGHHGDTVPLESQGDIYFVEGPVGEIDIFGIGRIHKALNDAGWPAGPREIFPGNVLLQGSVYARLDSLLTVLFDAADAEFPGVANVYISKTGYVTFHGRYARFDPTNPDYGIQTFKAGGEDVASLDDTVALLSNPLKFRRSKDDIINAAVYLPQGVDVTDLPTGVVKDDTSIDTYGWRSDSQENLLIQKGRVSADTTTFDVDAVDVTHAQANWKVQNYKNPRTRVYQMTFQGRDPNHFSAPATWALICDVEIGDIISLETNHPGGGGFDEDFYVEGIHYVASPRTEGIEGGFPDITLTLDVSPKSLYDFNPFS